MKVALIILVVILVGVGVYVYFSPSLSSFRVQNNALTEADNKVILKAQSLVRVLDTERLAEDLIAYHLEKRAYPNSLIDFFKDTSYARTFAFSQDSIDTSLPYFSYHVSLDKQHFLLVTSLTLPKQELRKGGHSQSVVRVAQELFKVDCTSEMVYCVNETIFATSTVY